MPEVSHRPLAHSLESVRPLHQLCREGRLYNVERWIADEKPLQLTPEAVPKRTRPKTALQIALQTGQHSLATLLLRNGYQLELERYSPLDLALRSRRWDLFDLLLEWGGDFKSVDLYTVLETYNADLYERFWASGYDLTERHVMASILGHSTSNRPLLGFVKRHRTEDPRIQRELNMALGDHAGEGNERGVALCLWAGADPHAPVLSPNLEAAQDAAAAAGLRHLLPPIHRKGVGCNTVRPLEENPVMSPLYRGALKWRKSPRAVGLKTEGRLMVERKIHARSQCAGGIRRLQRTKNSLWVHLIA
jgi:hypothetical protein